MPLALLALLFSGLAQAAISPPLGWIFLHPFSWIPALAVFSRLEGRRALLAGWLVGTAAELAIYVWLPGTVIRFGEMPAPVGVAMWLLYASLTGFYTGLFAWGFGRVRRAGGRAWPFAAAAWFCALEFLNPQLFGYLQGVAWYQVPHLFLVTAATGVSGASFLVIACNAVLLQGLEAARNPGEPRRGAWLANAAVLGLLLAAAAAYSSARMATIDAAESAATPLRVALIQPLHTIPLRRAMVRESSDSFARDYVALSREAQQKDDRHIDAFVWPEGALDVDPMQRRNAAVLEFARESGSEIWLGATHYDREAARKNGGRIPKHVSAFRIFADGRVDQRYDKNILVPFGEFMPLKDTFPILRGIRAAGDFEAGHSIPKYDLGPTRFVFAVCYEAIRSSFVREAIGQGDGDAIGGGIGKDANLIANVTIDAWYGEWSEQSQHLMLAASQSAMNGIPLVRSTSTGISAFVDARGVITASTGNFTRETLVRDVKPVRVPGPYSRHGDRFAWICVAASVLLLVRGAKQRH